MVWKPETVKEALDYLEGLPVNQSYGPQQALNKIKAALVHIPEDSTNHENLESVNGEDQMPHWYHEFKRKLGYLDSAHQLSDNVRAKQEELLWKRLEALEKRFETHRDNVNRRLLSLEHWQRG